MHIGPPESGFKCLDLIEPVPVTWGGAVEVATTVQMLPQRVLDTAPQGSFVQFEKDELFRLYSMLPELACALVNNALSAASLAG